MTALQLITDCQFGSTGKGLFAGYLAQHQQPDTLVMAPSPNAGHTLVLPGHTLIHKMLPLGVTSRALRRIILGPGSILDLDRLQSEIEYLRLHKLIADDVSIYVHRNAAVVLPEHRDAEAEGGTAPGSTRQGTGAAQMARVKRSPKALNVADAIQHPVWDLVERVNTTQLQGLFFSSVRAQVEGCQGYSLSVFHGVYPYVTCRDVTTASLLSDCGIPLPSLRSLHVFGTFRTYPIRVANRPESGENSGPTYDDSREIQFADLGLKQELTTVTKLPRRLFTFSYQQAIEACAQNRVNSAFLNFAQYPPDFAALRDIWLRLSECTRVDYFGFGPRPEDVYRIGAPGIADTHLEALYERHKHISTAG